VCSRGASTVTTKCPFCLEDLELQNGVFPYHDHPKPTRRICSGAKKTPEDALEEFVGAMFTIARELFDLGTEALAATPGITVTDVPFMVGDEDE